MARSAAHHVITANRLRDGWPVWLCEGGAFSESLEDAVIFPESDLASGLAAGEAAIAARLVVGVYKVPVKVQQGRPVVTSVRERIRATGPSVRVEPGIQPVSGAQA
jgi:sulfite reductase (NADPH) hemoprotein beta-component